MEKIGIIGIGKLGLCLALQLEKAGYEVIGVDTHEAYIDQINRKTLDSDENGVTTYLQNAHSFHATTDFGAIVRDDIPLIIILVATPTHPEAGYDHIQIEKVTDQLLDFGPQRIEKHLIIGCTTMPGFCDRLANKMAAYNYTVSYKPEFVAQGSIIRDMENPDLLLIGEANSNVGDKIEEVFVKICGRAPAVHRMDRISAEISKLSVNCFLTMKISFANSIGDLALSAGANPEKILAAVGSDTRIGKKFLQYGYGYGGPCLPRDNRALQSFALDKGLELPLSKATDLVNKTHLDFQAQQQLNTTPNGEAIIFDYVTFKKESVSLEDAQQLALAVRLAEMGKKVIIKERSGILVVLREQYGDLFQYELS